MWRRAIVAGIALASAVAGAGVGATAAPTLAAAATSPPAASMSGSQIAAAPRVPLAQGAAPVPSGAAVVGGVPSSTTVDVEVSLAPPDPAALAAYVAGVATPASPEHGQYLTPSQFAARFAPSPATVAAVVRWLEAEGLQVGTLPGDRLSVPAHGAAPAVAAAFGTALSTLRLPSGRTAYAPSAPPSVPSPVAPVVQGVAGLDDVARWRPLLTAQHLVEGPAGAPSAPGAPAAGTVPGASAPAACPTGQGLGTSRSYTRIASIYDLQGLYRQGRLGAGVTVDVFELEGWTTAELATFDACYGVSPQVRNVPVDGGPTGGGSTPVGAAGLETSLDVETLAALAPGAAINVFQGPRTGTGALATLQAIATTPTAQVVSTSWGQCEPVAQATAGDTPYMEARLFQQMAVEGKTVLAAAGDSGSEGCWSTPTATASTTKAKLYVDDPASQPTVTSVGGTRLGSTTSPATQTVWSTLLASGGGGGVSSIWSMPKYQRTSAPVVARLAATVPPPAATCPHAATTTTPAPSSCRAVPDVAADAAPATGYTVFYDGRWVSDVGGTSGGAPLWASVMALTDQGCNGRVGEANPALYRLGTTDPSVFTDVTTGTNNILQPGTNTTRYRAGPGYDLATGWGTPVGGALLAALQPSGGCPAVTGLSSHGGPLGGGSSVTISGSGLAGATAVHFGPAAAAVQSASAGSVTVQVPASPALDTVDVTVTTPNGTSAPVAGDQYTYERTGGGYWLGAADGGLFAFGSAPFYGSMGGRPLNAPVVGIAATPDGRGYWEVASDGGIFAFGDAQFYGSMGGHPLDAPVVGIAATPDGRGYWEVASDGGLFAFGDAQFYGSMGGRPLNQPIVGLAAARNGAGYWEVAADGGIFAFGDAPFLGSMGGRPLNRPVVGIGATPDGGGYWEVASDGGIFAFGDAGFSGSMGGRPLNAPVVALVATPDGGGYREVASDGGIFAFGDARFYGSMGGRPLNAPVVAMASP